MKLILAHLKKDAITFRTLLWIWGACVAFDCLFALLAALIVKIPASGMGIAFFLSVFASLILGLISTLGLQFILLAVIIVGIIQTDSLQESDAFWRTRPISRRDLLLEKIFFVVLLVTGTALATLSLNFKVGSGIWIWPKAAACVLGLVAFAAVTTSFSKLILNGLGFALVAQATSSVLLMVLRYAAQTSGTLRDFFPIHANTDLTSGSMPLWIVALYIGGFLAVIVNQYLTLKINTSRAILFVTLLLTAVLQG